MQLNLKKPNFGSSNSYTKDFSVEFYKDTPGSCSDYFENIEKVKFSISVMSE